MIYISNIKLIFTFIFLFTSCQLLAEAKPCCTFDRPDSIAPIGVYADHLHKEDSVMLGYRLLYQKGDVHEMNHTDETTMQDYSDGLNHSENLSEEHTIVGPSNKHTHRPRMAMHMLEAMYAPSDSVSLMGMTMFHQMDMLHLEGDSSLRTENSGIGDTSLTALVRLYTEDRDRFHIGMGVSLPTGSVTNTDTYHNGESRHPYSMVLGSGTVDLLPSATFVSQYDKWSWGTQAMATLRTGENNEGYTLGDRYKGNLWFAYKPNDFVSPSLRLWYERWNDVSGRDPKITFTNAFGDPSQQAGDELSLAAGVNFLVRSGFLEGTRFGIEFGTPLTSSVDEGAHATNWFANLGAIFTL